MRKPSDARILAMDILRRSKCSVQVGAAIEDSRGIVAWGWNSEGMDGYGLHAEMHAIMRANPCRLEAATIYVASRRNRNGKAVRSKPCRECMAKIKKYGMKTAWRENNGQWIYDK